MVTLVLNLVLPQTTFWVGELLHLYQFRSDFKLPLFATIIVLPPSLVSVVWFRYADNFYGRKAVIYTMIGLGALAFVPGLIDLLSKFPLLKYK